MESLCHIEPLLMKSEEHFSSCNLSPLARKVAPESHIQEKLGAPPASAARSNRRAQSHSPKKL
jgi:hypothetical protein